MKILFTTAIIERFFDIRKEEYIKSFNALVDNFKIEPKDIFIIECYQHDKVDFLESLSPNVFYTRTHLNFIRNKGVLEALGLKSFLEKHKFSNEKVIKLTGRYLIETPTVFDRLDEHDAVAVLDPINQCFTGCIGMEYELFNEFISTLDLKRMEEGMINIEYLASEFLYRKRSEGKSVCFPEKLGVYSNINNQSIVRW